MRLIERSILTPNIPVSFLFHCLRRCRVASLVQAEYRTITLSSTDDAPRRRHCGFLQAVGHYGLRAL